MHLADSKDFPGQALRYGKRVYGIGLYPEITQALVDSWCTSERGSKKLSLPGVRMPGTLPTTTAKSTTPTAGCPGSWTNASWRKPRIRLANDCPCRAAKRQLYANGDGGLASFPVG